MWTDIFKCPLSWMVKRYYVLIKMSGGSQGVFQSVCFYSLSFLSVLRIKRRFNVLKTQKFNFSLSNLCLLCFSHTLAAGHWFWAWQHIRVSCRWKWDRVRGRAKEMTKNYLKKKRRRRSGVTLKTAGNNYAGSEFEEWKKISSGSE